MVSANFGFAIGTSSLAASVDATPNHEQPPAKRRKTTIPTDEPPTTTLDVQLTSEVGSKGKKSRRTLPKDDDKDHARHPCDEEDSFVFGQRKRPNYKKVASVGETRFSPSNASAVQKSKKEKRTAAIDSELITQDFLPDVAEQDKVQEHVEEKCGPARSTKRKGAVTKRKAQSTTTSKSKTNTRLRSRPGEVLHIAVERELSKRSNEATGTPPRDLEGSLSSSRSRNGQSCMPALPDIAQAKSGLAISEQSACSSVKENSSTPCMAISKTLSAGPGRSWRETRVTNSEMGFPASVEVVADLKDAPEHQIMADHGQRQTVQNSKPRRQNRVGRCRRFDSAAPVAGTSVADPSERNVDNGKGQDDPAPVDAYLHPRRLPLTAVDRNVRGGSSSPGKKVVEAEHASNGSPRPQISRHQSVKAKNASKSRSQKQCHRSTSPIQGRGPAKADGDQHVDITNGPNVQKNAQHTASLTQIARPEHRDRHQRYVESRDGKKQSQTCSSSSDAEVSENHRHGARAAKSLAYSRFSRSNTTREANTDLACSACSIGAECEAVEMSVSGSVGGSADENIDWLLDEPAPSHDLPRRRPRARETRTMATPSKQPRKDLPEVDLDELICNITDMVSGPRRRELDDAAVGSFSQLKPTRKKR